MDDEEFQIGSGNWSQLSKNSRRSSSSPPTPPSTHVWPIQVVDVTKQPLHQDHPNLQYMTGLGLASQPVEWNQPSLFRGGIEKSDENFSFRSMLQEDHDHSRSTTTSFQQAEQPWMPRSQKLVSYSSSSAATADSEAVFSSLNLSQFTSTTHHHHLNPNNIDHSFSPYPTSYGTNSSSSSGHDHQQFIFQPNSLQAPNNKPPNQLHLSNKAPFWNASPAAPIINHDVRSNLFPSLQMQSPSSTFDEKPKESSSSETSNKRPRNETPSPLPAKPKKEKMGDRITALQQLVSPFGKTDTASVLSEAIEYIKFLHEQVGVLSNAYMKSGAPIQQQKCEKSSDEEGQQQDLRSRGLCLVPVSSTFPVTHETTVDFWNPTFGGSFR
ncbi:hypothetical protein ACET3Z_021594 [Daucus carota]